MSDLSEHHDELRSVARDLLAPATADEVSWDQLAEVGWLGLEVPEALDGSGATFAEAAIVIEELGRAAVASSFLGTAVLGVGALVAVVPTARRDELLRQVAVGAARVAVAVAPGGDDALVDPPFRLVSSGDALQLDGRAEFVADAAEADALLLLARSGDEVVVVHVPADRATVEAQPVLDATRRFATAEVTGLAVEAGDVWTFVDGAPAAQELVDRAALAVACDSLGVASAMLDATVAYASERAQFGRPIGSFQAVQHACADLLVEVTIGRELLDAAIGAVAAGDAEAGTHVARASSFVTQAAVDVVGAAMQLHGAIGYSWESGIHVYFKRAVLNRSLFGSPAAQRRRLSARLAPSLEPA